MTDLEILYENSPNFITFKVYKLTPKRNLIANLEVSKPHYLGLLKLLNPKKSFGPTHYSIMGFYSEEERDEISSEYKIKPVRRQNVSYLRLL